MKKNKLCIFIIFLITILLFSIGAFYSKDSIVTGGKEVDGLSNNRPIAVMVENSSAARPQSGLHLADVVFEVVDEYGITRFVAIYCTKDASIVGPVRSTRPYYAEIARGFDPIYAFFGTYPECYKKVQDMGMYVLSAMTDRSGCSSITAQASYWRDWNRSSIQEHTAFMSTIQLKQNAQKLGYPLEGNGIPFHFKSDAPESERGNTSNINIDFSTTVYSPRGFDVNFKYNKASNSYLRYMAGYPHKDYESGQQINVKNVVVMITDIEGPLDKYGHMYVRTVGSGTAFLFIDGKAIQGSWERGSVYEPFTYKDNNGDIVLFNSGSTWIAMVQGLDKVSF